MIENFHFLSDDAICNPEQDLFNFKYYAEKVQKLIQQNSNNSESLTIGIYGKWGEGKTSFLNLIENRIEYFEKGKSNKEYLKFHFNPWRYSNEDEMLFDFFDSLSKKFYVKEKTDLQEIGLLIKKYSKYLKAIKISSTVGIPKIFTGKVSVNVDEIFKAIGEDISQENLTLDILKDKVNDKITAVNFKVVVFIDDIDRLDKDEIYTILKLIKLNANFSNFIFVVNLDEEHVSKAIKSRYGNSKKDGKYFIEKIINIPVSLPKIESEDLQHFFEIKIKKIFNSFEIKNQELKEVYLKEIVQDFSPNHFKSPREIIRILNSFYIGAFALSDEVNLKDLFWIEWLKLKNEKLYKKIRDYNPHGMEGVFSGQSQIINFNDETGFQLERKISNGENINGTRKVIIDEFKDYKWIIDKLFPNFNVNEELINAFDASLNINSTQHFEKFFSYHTVRKVEIVKLNQIKSLIEKNESESLKNELEKLFNSNVESYKALYNIEGIIKNVSLSENREYFFKFMFQNIDLIPLSEKDVFEENFRLRIVKLIGRQLNDDNGNNNGKIAIELANNLFDLDQLLNFIISFDEKKSFKKDIELIFLKKSKEKLSDEIAFYEDSEMILNRWFLDFWHKYEPEEFKEYIEKSIINIDNIKHLIRNFSVIFNGKKFGALSKEKYDYMGKSINLDFLFSKIQEFDDKMIETVDISKFQFDNYDESTLEFNIKQFIYWYKKEQELKAQELHLAAFGKIKP